MAIQQKVSTKNIWRIKISYEQNASYVHAWRNTWEINGTQDKSFSWSYLPNLIKLIPSLTISTKYIINLSKKAITIENNLDDQISELKELISSKNSSKQLPSSLPLKSSEFFDILFLLGVFLYSAISISSSLAFMGYFSGNNMCYSYVLLFFLFMSFRFLFF